MVSLFHAPLTDALSPPCPCVVPCRLSQQGRRPDAAELARVYGADPEVLQAVLRHNSVPVVHATQEGRLHGAWPRGTAPAR